MIINIKIHPGEILQTEFLNEMGINPETLAEGLNISNELIYRILSGQENISQNLALKLSEYFKVPSDFFINLQSEYNKRLQSLGVGTPKRE